LPIWWGNTVSWSPDARNLAWLTLGRRDAGKAFITSVADGITRSLGDSGTPTFQRTDATGFNYRTQVPRWDAKGENVHLISAVGALWRLNARSGDAKRLATIDGFEIQTILNIRNRALPASGRIVVTARPSNGATVGLYAIDLATGASRSVAQPPPGMASGGNFGISDSGDISMVLQGAQYPNEVWLLENGSSQLRQVSDLGAPITRYPLARVREIQYMSANGDHLRGALLLPPAYEPGRRYPMVVWVYNGRGGAEGMNHFGLDDDTPASNLQMFATRGYAVLYPEAPLRKGTPMQDVVATVIPAVDRVIELGIADPDLLAVAGHSYGSYCSLALLTQTTRFKAGLIGGLRDWDLFSAYITGPRTSKSFGGYFRSGQGNIGGTPWDNEQRYMDNSPFFRFDKILAPILMTQGSRDALLQADRNYKALSALDKKAEYRIYQDEGHVLMRGVDVADYWMHQLDFVAANLGVARDANGVIMFDGGRARRIGAPK
ncbi:MAG: alpha/beta hydrolase family protein, partial [Gemmatimonadaceae bacterium]